MCDSANQLPKDNILKKTENHISVKEVVKKKKKKRKKKNRCSFESCSKKLQISALLCKCDMKFCGLHRLPHQHKCKHIHILEKDVWIKKCGLGGVSTNQLEVI